MVMVGAAALSLPVDAELIQAEIRRAFGGKGPRVLEINLDAFRLGMDAVTCATA